MFLFLIFRLFREMKFSSPPVMDQRFSLSPTTLHDFSPFKIRHHSKHSGVQEGKKLIRAMARFCVFDTFLSWNYINGTKLQNGMRVIKAV